MNRTYGKLQRRSVKGSLTRFLSILGIVVIGAGFLAGLLATAPDMKLTVDQYYDQNHTMDVDVKGTLGVTDDDVAALQALPEVDTIMPACVTDVILNGSDGSSYVVRLCGVPLEKRGTNEFLDDFLLTSGRMPESSDEVVLVCPNEFGQQHQIGETFTISPENRDYEDRADTYAVETFTAVGIARTPSYMTVETEPSNVGIGKVELIFYADRACYSLDVDTDLFIGLTDLRQMNSFLPEYKEKLEAFTDSMEDFGKQRSVIRYDEVQKEGNDELDDARADYAEAKADAEADLADARKKLDDAQAELADAKTDLEKGQKQYDYAHYQFYKQKNAFTKQIDSQHNQLSQALHAGLITQAEFDAQHAVLEDARKEGTAEFNKQHKKLEDAKKELADGEETIRENEVKLADAEKEYADAEDDLVRELADAQQKIDDAQKELDDLEEPEWVIRSRLDSVSYSSYKSNTEKIDAIAKVFPIFLFLVAALVALTTMTRMVEEERTQIGTLKALGYSNGQILSYYLGYSIWASFLGCALGMVIGFNVLPAVISMAYSMMYTLPPIVTVFRWDLAAIITPIAVCCTTLATLWACLSTLKEKPSQLMLPKAPKAGKRIILEYVTFLWKRMKFTQKVTCRNIFRYKKRLYMTMIGIAGCTALLLTGFGLRDSINDIVEKQFGELYHFDMTVYLKNGEVLDQNPFLQEYLNTSGKVSSYAPVHLENGKVHKGGETVNTNIYVPKQAETLKQHIELRQRNKAHTDIPFDDTSAVLTEKMCETLNVGVGDTVELENDGGKRAKITITGVTENYVTSYAFISDATYMRLFGNEPEFNRVIAETSGTDDDTENQISKELLADEDVTLVTFNSSIEDSFNNLIGNINYIVYVLIVAAGALAMIVLYNLTNINISERKKELATIKVLGFYEPEVSRYIYRETTWLSILGTLAGFVFGIWLHAFVVHTAEVDAVMFGRTLYPKSFLLAAAVTLLFTLLVDLIMLPKIRKIDMVESMKANE